MTVDECVAHIESVVPTECTDTYQFNGEPYLVDGKVNREAVGAIAAMDREYLTTLAFALGDCLIHNGWIKGEHAARTVLARLK